MRQNKQCAIQPFLPLPLCWSARQVGLAPTNGARIEDGTVTEWIMVAPPSAEQSNLKGWLSHGIRARVRFDSNGSALQFQNAAAFLAERLEGSFKGHPLFPPKYTILERHTEADVSEMAVVRGHKPELLSEPEICLFYVVLMDGAYFHLEVTVPESKRSELSDLLRNSANKALSFNRLPPGTSLDPLQFFALARAPHRAAGKCATRRNNSPACQFPGIQTF